MAAVMDGALGPWARPRAVYGYDGAASRDAGPLIEISDSTEAAPAPDKAADLVTLGEPESAAGDGLAPPLQGLVQYMADGAEYDDCATGDRYAIATGGDYEALEHAVLAASIERPGEAILTTFEGTFGEASEGEPAEVSVERFIGVWPGKDCETRVDEIGLINTFWKIVQLRDSKVSTLDKQTDPHVVFQREESRFSASVGCHQIVGAYALDEGRLTFEAPSFSSMVACQPPLAEWERALIGILDDTAAWEIEETRLSLLDASGERIALFEAVLLE